MSIFDETYRELMEMVGGPGGVFGDLNGEHGGSVGNTDSYAPGDARVPSYIGATKKGKKKKKKGKGKGKKSGNGGALEVEVTPIIQRRTFPNS